MNNYSINDLLALRRGEVVAFRREEQGYCIQNIWWFMKLEMGDLAGTFEYVLSWC
ncbi:hypothetical protein J4429_02605 [Candidatus Pacearchaeota archaeon]|nr:hypothetical protein [Candidatus Pacearchaeota archaeon]